MAKCLPMFAQSLTVKEEVRVMTSGGDATFWNPLDGRVEGNGLPAQWMDVPAGTNIHLISYSAKPDQATILVEVATGSGFARVGTVLRKGAWEKLLAVCE